MTAGLQRNGSGMSLLDEALWEQGAMSRSSVHQMRRFAMKLLAGQPVTVGAPLESWDASQCPPAEHLVIERSCFLLIKVGFLKLAQ